MTYDCLLLKNQLCFPLYAASREILRKYTPLLKELDLTYTQYIVMMVLWEEKKLTVGELGKKLFLDTGTLSPLLKSMEKKMLLRRTRDCVDERIVMVDITEEGEALKEKLSILFYIKYSNNSHSKRSYRHKKNYFSCENLKR